MMEELLPAIVQDNSSLLQLNDSDDNSKIKSVNDPKNDNHHNNTNDNNNMNNYTVINEYNDNDDIADNDDHNDDNIDINHHKVNIVTWFTFYSQREQREYYYEPISGITTWVVPQIQEQTVCINNNNDTMMIDDIDTDTTNDNTADATTTTMIINRIMIVMNHIYSLFMNIVHHLNMHCKKVVHTYYNHTNNKNDDDDDPTDTTDTNKDHYQYDMKTKQMIDRLMNLMNHILNVIIESINHMIVYCNNMIHTSYNKLITVWNDRTTIDTTTDNHHDIDIDTTTTIPSTPIRRLIHRIMIRMKHVYDLIIESMNSMIASMKDVHINHIVPIITKRPIAIGLFVCNILLFYIYFFMILKSSTTLTTSSNHTTGIGVPKSPLSSSSIVAPPTTVFISIDQNDTIPSTSSSLSMDDDTNNNVQPSLLYLENDINNSDTYEVNVQEEGTYIVDTNQSTDNSNDNNDDVDNVNNAYIEVKVEEAPIDDGNEENNDHVSLIDIAVKTSDDTIISIDEKLLAEDAIHDVTTTSTGTNKQHMLNDDDDDDQYESTHAATITTSVNDVANTSLMEQQQQQQQEQKIEKEQFVNTTVVSDSTVNRLVQNHDIIEPQTAIPETSIDQNNVNEVISNTDTTDNYKSSDNTQNNDTTNMISKNNTEIPILDQIDIIQKEVYTIVQRVGNQAIMAGYDIELEPNLTNYNRTMIQPLIVNNNSNNTKE